MAQHDYVIDNQSFPATRTDLNNVLQAIVSNNSGTSAPSTTFANQIWYDSSANILYIRNEDNDANIPLMQFDQSADVAATLATVIDILDASGTDQAGTSLTIRAGAGTGTGAGGSIIFQTADGAGSTGSSVNAHATQVTITDDGKVGIGTASPDHLIDCRTTGETEQVVANFSSTGDGGDRQRLEIYIDPSTQTTELYGGAGGGAENDTNLAFSTRQGASGRVEAMRIDSSGNLLVGKTTTDVGTQGTRLDNTGRGFFTRSASFCLQANRLSSDGEIMRFSKDGTTVGSIGSISSDLFIDGASSHAGVRFVSGHLRPRFNASDADNTIDLGISSFRFDDIFATNGTIQTSDQNEKQDIVSLTSAEITAAKAISKLFKTFKWKDKVKGKGDSARTHTGVIAQEVQQAMTDAGLDATKYAFFCSDTWWEKDVEVPAVEAVEAKDAVYEDGELVSEAVEAVEAKDAYIRTDTYETKDEAPEGATERTRLGVRYPELLAFIGAATEQRLADIETRLAALEG